jgi:hypothetical protein
MQLLGLFILLLCLFILLFFLPPLFCLTFTLLLC